MDTDRVDVGLEKGVGKAKGWGDATDDPSTETEGKKDQAEGELQQDWGETKTRLATSRTTTDKAEAAHW